MKSRVFVRVIEESTTSMSALEGMPTRQAELRAAHHPVAGDQWQEMFSCWWHVAKVTETEVLIYLYVGPCEITPEQAHEKKTIPRAEFAEWILKRSGADFNGNSNWIAQAAGFYKVSDLPFSSQKELQQYDVTPEAKSP